MNTLYRTQDIKLFVMMCSLCQLGLFSLAQSHFTMNLQIRLTSRFKIYAAAHKIYGLLQAPWYLE